MKIKIISLALLAVLFSCDSSQNQASEVESFLIGKGNLYGAGDEGIDKQNLTITDATAWEALMERMNAVNEESKNFKETQIDFSKYTIIAAFSKVQSNGGHSINLSVSSNGQEILVEVKEENPQGSMITVITQPYHIVKIAKSKLPIVFK